VFGCVYIREWQNKLRIRGAEKIQEESVERRKGEERGGYEERGKERRDERREMRDKQDG